MQVQTIYKRVTIKTVGLALVFLVPACLIVADEISSTAFFVLSLAGIAFIFRVEKRVSPQLVTPEEKIILLVFVIYFLATLLSYFWGDMSALGSRKIGRYARFLLVVPLYFIVKQLQPAASMMFWCGASTGAILAGLVAMNQVWWRKWLEEYYYRAEGSVNAIAFGDYSLLLAALSVASFGVFLKKGKWYSLLPASGMILGFVGCILSEARGSLIAIPATAIAWAFLAGRSSPWPRRIAIVAIIAVPGLVTIANHIPSIAKAFLLVPRLNTTVFEIEQLAVAGNYDPKTGIGARIELWLAGWETFKNHPILGIGVGDYQKSAALLVASGYSNSIVVKHNHVHNEFLMALTERGIVGFIALLAIFLIPLRSFWRAAKSSDPRLQQMGIGGTITVIAVMHFGLTEAIFDRTLHITFYTFAVAFFLAGIKSSTITNQRDSQ